MVLEYACRDLGFVITRSYTERAADVASWVGADDCGAVFDFIFLLLVAFDQRTNVPLLRSFS